MQAVAGLRRIASNPSSWKLESSRTTSVRGPMRGSCSRAETRRLPATTTSLPAARTISPIRVVVVVLPLVPLTPVMRGLGHSRKKSVISMYMGTPCESATCRQGWVRGTPGLRTTKSAPAKSASRCSPKTNCTS